MPDLSDLVSISKDYPLAPEVGGNVSDPTTGIHGVVVVRNLREDGGYLYDVEWEDGSTSKDVHEFDVRVAKARNSEWERLHPRDRNGRFIRVGAILSLGAVDDRPNQRLRRGALKEIDELGRGHLVDAHGNEFVVSPDQLKEMRVENTSEARRDVNLPAPKPNAGRGNLKDRFRRMSDQEKFEAGKRHAQGLGQRRRDWAIRMAEDALADMPIDHPERRYWEGFVSPALPALPEAGGAPPGVPVPDAGAVPAADAGQGRGVPVGGVPGVNMRRDGAKFRFFDDGIGAPIGHAEMVTENGRRIGYRAFDQNGMEIPGPARGRFLHRHEVAQALKDLNDNRRARGINPDAPFEGEGEGEGVDVAGARDAAQLGRDWAKGRLGAAASAVREQMSPKRKMAFDYGAGLATRDEVIAMGWKPEEVDAMDAVFTGNAADGQLDAPAPAADPVANAEAVRGQAWAEQAIRNDRRPGAAKRIAEAADRKLRAIDDGVPDRAGQRLGPEKRPFWAAVYQRARDLERNPGAARPAAPAARPEAPKPPRDMPMKHAEELVNLPEGGEDQARQLARRLLADDDFFQDGDNPDDFRPWAQNVADNANLPEIRAFGAEVLAGLQARQHPADFERGKKIALVADSNALGGLAAGVNHERLSAGGQAFFAGVEAGRDERRARIAELQGWNLPALDPVKLKGRDGNWFLNERGADFLQFRNEAGEEVNVTNPADISVGGDAPLIPGLTQGQSSAMHYSRPGDDKLTGPVSGIKNLGGGINTTLKGKIKGKTVIVKPLEGAYDLQARQGIPKKSDFQRELGASIVANWLGVNMPHVTVRQVDESNEGAFNPKPVGPAVVMEFVRGTVAHNKMGRGGMDTMVIHDFNKTLRKIAFLDSIIGNTDRHAGNWMVTANGDHIPIDHGLSFPTDNDYLRGNNQIQNSTAFLPKDRELTESENQMLLTEMATGDIARELSKAGLEPEAVEAFTKRVEAAAREGKILTTREMEAALGVAAGF